MTTRSIYLFAATCLSLSLLASCQSSSTPTEEGMAKFTTDDSFSKAHEIPEELDFQGRGEMISFPTSDGKEGHAYVLHPSAPSNKHLLVIHEWWGLNDHIKQEAERLFDSLGVHVWALDLYDGQVATDQETAGKLMESRDQKRLEAIISGALAQFGATAKIATTGWCFGGGWSLRASILAGDRATGCVMYYGMPVENAKDLVPLKAEMLGLFASQDKWINAEVVRKFAALCQATGKTFTYHFFDADHAFANPSSPRFDEASAREANELSLTFLRNKLR
ncbi:MAG: dienelactone hydrolase family protein [Saprospiraceae bacterium]|nr:dienelactone hydrolase family protein [Saprospiraceae bacterium]